MEREISKDGPCYVFLFRFLINLINSERPFSPPIFPRKSNVSVGFETPVSKPRPRCLLFVTAARAQIYFSMRGKWDGEQWWCSAILRGFKSYLCSTGFRWTGLPKPVSKILHPAAQTRYQPQNLFPVSMMLSCRKLGIRCWMLVFAGTGFSPSQFRPIISHNMAKYRINIVHYRISPRVLFGPTRSPTLPPVTL